MRSSARIERFLLDHQGDLLVAVGYCTAGGMAWLAERSHGRSVRLLIGDARSMWWGNASDADRSKCMAFLARPDVEVRNWYRTGKSKKGQASAHLKVWAVHDSDTPSAVLIGSSNLTRQGLDANVEVMAEAADADIRPVWDSAAGVWAEAWKCGERISGYLGVEAASQMSPAPAPEPEAQRVGRVCPHGAGFAAPEEPPPARWATVIGWTAATLSLALLIVSALAASCVPYTGTP